MPEDKERQKNLAKADQRAGDGHIVQQKRQRKYRDGQQAQRPATKSLRPAQLAGGLIGRTKLRAQLRLRTSRPDSVVKEARIIGHHLLNHTALREAPPQRPV